ncbi:MAG: nucleoside deaminase [Ginsengibacter sp.]
MQDDEYFMKQALKEAMKALEENEVPIGAVVVMQQKVIARGYNQVERLNDATAHAEMIALTAAFNYLGSKYLPEASLYVTIEPCVMCCGALYWSKTGRVVFGARDPKHGGLSKWHANTKQPEMAGNSGSLLHPKAEVVSGICEKESLQLLQNFFKKKR